jgi:hypothetical protein
MILVGGSTQLQACLLLMQSAATRETSETWSTTQIERNVTKANSPYSMKITEVRWVNKWAHRVTNLWDTKLQQAPLHNSVYRGIQAHDTIRHVSPDIMHAICKQLSLDIGTNFQRSVSSWQSIVDGYEKFLKQSVRQAG